MPEEADPHVKGGCRATNHARGSRSLRQRRLRVTRSAANYLEEKSDSRRLVAVCAYEVKCINRYAKMVEQWP